MATTIDKCQYHLTISGEQEKAGKCNRTPTKNMSGPDSDHCRLITLNLCEIHFNKVQRWLVK